MSGSLDRNNNDVTGVKSPNASKNAANKEYVDLKVETVFYFCSQLTHNNNELAKFTTTSNKVLMSNCIHFAVGSNSSLRISVSGLYEIHYKDG